MSAVNTSSIKSKTNKSVVAGSVTPSENIARKSTAPSALSRGQTVEYTLRGASNKSLVKSATKSAPRSKLTVMKSADGSRRSSLKPSRTGSRLPSRTASRDASRNASRTGLASSASRTTASTNRSLSVPRSSRSRQTRSHTRSSTKTPSSYNTVSNSRLPASKRSSYLETPSASKTKTGTRFTIPSRKSGASVANTQYKLRNVQTCAGKTNAWDPVSQAEAKSAKSVTVTKSKSMVSVDIESQRPHPKDIVIEEREVTRTRYSWWALSILAFLLCATLIFLIVKEIVESNATETSNDNSANQPANKAGTTAPKGKLGKQ